MLTLFRGQHFVPGPVTIFAGPLFSSVSRMTNRRRRVYPPPMRTSHRAFGIAMLLAAAACGSTRGAGGPRSVAARQRMQRVPAGTLGVGATCDPGVGALARRDGRRVELRAFFVDRVPVLGRDFAQFAQEEALRVEPGARDFDPRVSPELAARHQQQRADGYGAHPAVMVSWGEAAAYCAWRGARLPTEMEWERAARGDDGRAYPWGDGLDATRLDSIDFGARDTSPVLAHPRGRSPFGLFDLVGNAAEWTSTPAPSPDQMIVRGSAWNEPAAHACLERRRALPREARSVALSFRCARDATP